MNSTDHRVPDLRGCYDHAIAHLQPLEYRLTEQSLEVELWQQSWPSSAGGWGVAAGQTFTTSFVVVMWGPAGDAIVYLGNRPAYQLPAGASQQELRRACRERSVPGVRQACRVGCRVFEPDAGLGKFQEPYWDYVLKTLGDQAVRVDVVADELRSLVARIEAEGAAQSYRLYREALVHIAETCSDPDVAQFAARVLDGSAFPPNWNSDGVDPRPSRT